MCNLVKKSGNVTFKGQDISEIPTKDIIKMGITMVPEGRRVFSDLTIYENLVLGAYTRKDKDNVKQDIDWVYSIFPRLEEKKSTCRHPFRRGTTDAGFGKGSHV